MSFPTTDDKPNEVAFPSYHLPQPTSYKEVEENQEQQKNKQWAAAAETIANAGR